MKKLIALMMAMAMALSLIACGSSSAPAATDASASDASASAATSDASAADASAAADQGGIPDPNGDLSYVQDKGTLVVGITDFEPMDYKDESGEWIGFDADLAKDFASYLGVDIEFQEINWDNKILELDGKSIDCIWNGMTLTDEVTSATSCANPYMRNAQVVILPADKAEQYPDIESMKDLSFAVESGSAGEKAVNDLGYNTTPVTAQADALMEVSSGNSDAAVIDLLMAYAMTGEGTSYADLASTISLNEEQYGVAFRKDSDLTDSLNAFLKMEYEAGNLDTLAEQYGLAGSIIEQK